MNMDEFQGDTYLAGPLSSPCMNTQQHIDLYRHEQPPTYMHNAKTPPLPPYEKIWSITTLVSRHIDGRVSFSKWNHVPTLPHAPLLLCEPSISTGWHVSLRQIMYVRVSLPRWLLQILAVYQQAYLVFILGTGVNWWKIDFWTRPWAVPKA